MVSSSRDRIRRRLMVRLALTARTPPPAFLFPDQRCQRPKPTRWAPPKSVGGAGRRLSRESQTPCQPALSSFLFVIPKSGIQSAKTVQGSRGKPSKHRDDSIGARNLVAELRRCKRFFNRLARGAPPVSERGADIRTAHFGHNPPFAESTKILRNSGVRDPGSIGFPLPGKGWLSRLPTATCGDGIPRAPGWAAPAQRSRRPFGESRSVSPRRCRP